MHTATQRDGQTFCLFFDLALSWRLHESGPLNLDVPASHLRAWRLVFAHRSAFSFLCGLAASVLRNNNAQAAILKRAGYARHGYKERYRRSQS